MSSSRISVLPGLRPQRKTNSSVKGIMPKTESRVYWEEKPVHLSLKVSLMCYVLPPGRQFYEAAYLTSRLNMKIEPAAP